MILIIVINWPVYIYIGCIVKQIYSGESFIIVMYTLSPHVIMLILDATLMSKYSS